MKQHNWEQQSNRLLYIIFGCAMLLLIIISVFYIKNEESVWRKQAFKQLKNTAVLKSREVEAWHMEQLGDAREIAQSPLLHDAVSQWRSLKEKQTLKSEIQQRLKLFIKNNPDFINIFLIDTTGNILLAANSGMLNLKHEVTGKLIQEVVKTNKLVFSDLFKSNHGDSVYADIAYPIRNQGIYTIILFRINMTVNLYPILQSLYSDNTTEESFLFGVHRDSVLFLSNLKSRPNTVLSLKIPMTNKDNPAVKSILNGPGFYNGIGYHGEEIMEYILPIKGTSWFLASKIDSAELFSPVYMRIKKQAIVLSLLFITLSAIFFLVINYRRKHFLNELLEEERQQAALKSHYEYVVKYANDIILLEDENLNIIEANQRAQQTYQYQLEELKKMKKTDLVAPEFRESDAEWIKNLTKDEGSIVESMHQRKDGSLFNVEISARIIKVDGKDFKHQVIRDITERKLADIALRESEERFRTTLYSTGDSIIATDINGHIRYMNRVAEALTGWTEAEASGKPIREVFRIFNEYTREEVENPVDKVLANGIIVLLSNHTFLVSKDGREIPIGDSGAPIHDAEGKISGAVLVFQDQTKDRLAQKALEMSELHFHSLSNNAPVGIFRTRPDGFTTYVNPHWCLLSGLTEKEALGDGWLAAVHPDDRENLAKGWKIAIQNKAISNAGYRFLRSDGTIVYVMGHTVPEINSKNEINGYVGTITDITEQKNMFDELSVAKEKAEESNRLKSAFLANMSHEIRTPMNGILGFAELLKGAELSGEQQHKYIDIIEKSGQRMLNIINDIVSISKIESGHIDIHLSETNINKQIEFVYNTLKLDAEKKSLNFSYILGQPEKEALIKTDSEKLYGILTNLVKNAIKYTDEGSIEFGYAKKGANLEFYVKDTGIGFPQERQDAIFERFIQADIEDKMARQGAGLGLSISKAYIEMLGGKIWTVSESGAGSIFYFTLPFTNGANEKKNRQLNVLPKIEEKPINSKISGLKVLIVEDDSVSRNFISILIKDLCEEVFEAETGIEAVEVCRNNAVINLVLMDIKLPDLDGYNTTRHIREFNKDVIIIAQTAYAFIGDKEKAIESGCNDYITKPIKKDELLALIQKYFNN